MINHYFTLIKIVEEMQHLIGCSVKEVFTQDRNSLIIALTDGRNDFIVDFLIKNSTPVLVLRESFARARKNTADLFPDLINETLQEVKLFENNRVIELKFINSILYILIFSGSNSNLILSRNDGYVIDSFKKSKDLAGKKIEIPEPNLMSLDSFPKTAKLSEVFSKCSLLLGKHYTKELLFRLKIAPDKTIESFNDKELNDIFSIALEFRQKCLNSKNCYLYYNDDTILFSLIKLQSLDFQFKEFKNINEAIMNKLIHNYREDNFNQLFKEMQSLLTKVKSRYEKNIERIKDESLIFERAKKYKRYAELLMTAQIQKEKNLQSIILNDYDNTETEIPLSADLSVLENANKYYDKYKSSKSELEIRKKRLPDMELKLMKVNNLLKQLENAEEKKELELIKKSMNSMSETKTESEKSDISSKFRQFDLGEGYILYVGKNAKNNEELTFGFAKPNDLWFHARGSGGSHAVLRLNKEEKVPKNILKKAGSIVAYYSQARNAKYTPVAYTFKKYLKKPKGANTGTVVISREEVIMVEPGLPETAE